MPDNVSMSQRLRIAERRKHKGRPYRIEEIILDIEPSPCASLMTIGVKNMSDIPAAVIISPAEILIGELNLRIRIAFQFRHGTPLAQSGHTILYMAQSHVGTEPFLLERKVCEAVYKLSCGGMGFLLSL